MYRYVVFPPLRPTLCSTTCVIAHFNHSLAQPLPVVGTPETGPLRTYCVLRAPHGVLFLDFVGVGRSGQVHPQDVVFQLPGVVSELGSEMTQFAVVCDVVRCGTQIIHEGHFPVKRRRCGEERKITEPPHCQHISTWYSVALMLACWRGSADIPHSGVPRRMYASTCPRMVSWLANEEVVQKMALSSAK